MKIALFGKLRPDTWTTFYTKFFLIPIPLSTKTVNQKTDSQFSQIKPQKFRDDFGIFIFSLVPCSSNIYSHAQVLFKLNT